MHSGHIAVLALLTGAASATTSAPHRASPTVRPNSNTDRAGVLRMGVLTVALEARESTWWLNGPDRPPVTIAAFAEPGKASLMPGPLVRAPVGTEIRLSIRNSLAKPLTFFVPSALRGGVGGLAVDSVVIAPGVEQTLAARATVPGNYVYRAMTPGGTTIDAPYTGLLAGALVVDSGRAVGRRDRVLMIMETTDSAVVACADSAKRNATGKCTVARTVFTINGRSWPSTERIHAAVGDSLHWRVLNASNEPHPMHLHGFYYRVDAVSGTLAGLPGGPMPSQLVVTQLMTPLSGISMSWSPDRPGNWLYHCHFAMHLHPDSLSAAPNDPHMHGMTGLVLGVDVSARPAVRVAAEPTAVRRLRLIAVEDSAGPGETIRMMAPSMRFVLEEDGRRTDVGPDFSPELDLARGEPVSITIVNHLREPTSVHWHGIEVEDSYVDGVPDFSGSGKRLSPAIAPRDSFEARFTPRRSGTFMYHAHVDEEREQVAGLEGSLIVRDPGEVPSDEHVFFVKSSRAEGEHAPLEINGRTNPDTVVLHAGQPARLRLLQLSTHHFTSNVTFRLSTLGDGTSAGTGDSTVVQWRPVAKDGADLPAVARTPRLAQQIVSMGETYDFEYTPRQRGLLRLDVGTTVIPGTPTRPRVLISVPIRVE